MKYNYTLSTENLPKYEYTISLKDLENAVENALDTFGASAVYTADYFDAYSIDINNTVKKENGPDTNAWLAVDKKNNFLIFQDKPLRDAEGGMWVRVFIEGQEIHIDYGLSVNPSNLAIHLQDRTWTDEPVNI